MYIKYIMKSIWGMTHWINSSLSHNLYISQPQLNKLYMENYKKYKLLG